MLDTSSHFPHGDYSPNFFFGVLGSNGGVRQSAKFSSCATRTLMPRKRTQPTGQLGKQNARLFAMLLLNPLVCTKLQLFFQV